MEIFLVTVVVTLFIIEWIVEICLLYRAVAKLTYSKSGVL
jgi:hypothetical protein